jgi:tetratricopeptide (TPR) repeat protein
MRALNDFANVLLIRREFDAAAITLAEALAISREVGYPDATGRVLTNLGLAVLSRGDAEKAAEYLSEALTLFARTGSVMAWAVLLGLAAVANTNDNPLRAARLLGASNHVAEEVGLSREAYEANLYENTLIAIRTALGDQTAEQLFAEGEKMPRNEAIAYALEGRD